MNILEVESLTKTYRRTPALHALTFRVPEGGRYGILGAAGAGKTTLLHTLLGFLRPTSGSIRVFGTTDLEMVRTRIGYIPSQFRYHRLYTPREYLFFLGQFSDIKRTLLSSRISELLEFVGLSHVATRLLATFSPEMLQRFGIAQALLGQPELLLVDDPTHHLDADARQTIRALLRHIISQSKMTVVLCSQDGDDIEELCDQAGILVDGHLVEQLDLRDIRERKNCLHLRVEALEPEVKAALHQISPAVQCDDHTITLYPNSRQLQESVLRALLDWKVTILSMETPRHLLHRYYSEKVQTLLAKRPADHSLVIPPTVATPTLAIPSAEGSVLQQSDIPVPGVILPAEQGNTSLLRPVEETDILLSELLGSAQPPGLHHAHFGSPGKEQENQCAR